LKDEHAERLRKISATLSRSFAETDDSAYNAQQQQQGLSLAKRAKRSDRALHDDELEAWRQVQKQIVVYKEMGAQEEDEEVLFFDACNLTHVMQRIDRITVLRRLEVREQILVALNDVLSALKRADEDDVEIDIGPMNRQGASKFRSPVEAARFYQKKYNELDEDFSESTQRGRERDAPLKRPPSARTVSNSDIHAAVQEALRLQQQKQVEENDGAQGERKQNQLEAPASEAKQERTIAVDTKEVEIKPDQTVINEAEPPPPPAPAEPTLTNAITAPDSSSSSTPPPSVNAITLLPPAAPQTPHSAGELRELSLPRF
jgi:hypothetical protein